MRLGRLRKLVFVFAEVWSYNITAECSIACPSDITCTDQHYRLPIENDDLRTELDKALMRFADPWIPGTFVQASKWNLYNPYVFFEICSAGLADQNEWREFNDEREVSSGFTTGIAWRHEAPVYAHAFYMDEDPYNEGPPVAWRDDKVKLSLMSERLPKAATDFLIPPVLHSFNDAIKWKKAVGDWGHGVSVQPDINDGVYIASHRIYSNFPTLNASTAAVTAQLSRRAQREINMLLAQSLGANSPELKAASERMDRTSAAAQASHSAALKAAASAPVQEIYSVFIKDPIHPDRVFSSTHRVKLLPPSNINGTAFLENAAANAWADGWAGYRYTSLFLYFSSKNDDFQIFFHKDCLTANPGGTKGILQVENPKHLRFIEDNKDKMNNDSFHLSEGDVKQDGKPSVESYIVKSGEGSKRLLLIGSDGVSGELAVLIELRFAADDILEYESSEMYDNALNRDYERPADDGLEDANKFHNGRSSTDETDKNNAFNDKHFKSKHQVAVASARYHGWKFLPSEIESKNISEIISDELWPATTDRGSPLMFNNSAPANSNFVAVQFLLKFPLVPAHRNFQERHQPPVFVCDTHFFTNDFLKHILLINENTSSGLKGLSSTDIFSRIDKLLAYPLSLSKHLALLKRVYSDLYQEHLEQVFPFNSTTLNSVRAKIGLKSYQQTDLLYKFRRLLLGTVISSRGFAPMSIHSINRVNNKDENRKVSSLFTGGYYFLTSSRWTHREAKQEDLGITLVSLFKWNPLMAIQIAFDMILHPNNFFSKPKFVAAERLMTTYFGGNDDANRLSDARRELTSPPEILPLIVEMIDVLESTACYLDGLIKNIEKSSRKGTNRKEDICGIKTIHLGHPLHNILLRNQRLSSMQWRLIVSHASVARDRLTNHNESFRHNFVNKQHVDSIASDMTLDDTKNQSYPSGNAKVLHMKRGHGDWEIDSMSESNVALFNILYSQLKAMEPVLHAWLYSFVELNTIKLSYPFIGVDIDKNNLDVQCTDGCKMIKRTIYRLLENDVFPKWKGSISAGGIHRPLQVPERPIKESLSSSPESALYGNIPAAHLDLHVWLLATASAMYRICLINHRGNCTDQFKLVAGLAIKMLNNPSKKTVADLFESNIRGTYGNKSSPYEGSQPGILTDFFENVAIIEPEAKYGGIKVPPMMPWRIDGRCGEQFLDGNGKPAHCSPFSDKRCCSPFGYCGSSPDHCNCNGCAPGMPLWNTEAWGFNGITSGHSPFIGFSSVLPLALGMLPAITIRNTERDHNFIATLPALNETKKLQNLAWPLETLEWTKNILRIIKNPEERLITKWGLVNVARGKNLYISEIKGAGNVSVVRNVMLIKGLQKHYLSNNATLWESETSDQRRNNISISEFKEVHDILLGQIVSHALDIWIKGDDKDRNIWEAFNGSDGQPQEANLSVSSAAGLLQILKNPIYNPDRASIYSMQR